MNNETTIKDVKFNLREDPYINDPQIIQMRKNSEKLFLATKKVIDACDRYGVAIENLCGGPPKLMYMGQFIT